MDGEVFMIILVFNYRIFNEFVMVKFLLLKPEHNPKGI